MGFACLIVLGPASVAWLAFPRHRVDRTTYDAIRAGMDEQELRGQLGRPANDTSALEQAAAFLADVEYLIPEDTFIRMRVANELRIGCWEVHNAWILVAFGPDGIAAYKELWTVETPRPRLLTSIRAWLGL